MKIFSQGLCPLCGGKKREGKTTYSADLGSSVVVVRNVSAMICDQCGEAWIDPQTAKKLENLGKEAQNKGTQIEVMAL